jgi:lipoprotein-anchoring transpeptidase ErfK/SrfK
MRLSSTLTTYRFVFGILLFGAVFWSGPGSSVVHAEAIAGEVPSPMQTSDKSRNLPPLPFLKPTLAVPAQARHSLASVEVRGLMASPDPATSPAVQAAKEAGDKWIEVDLSDQKVYAYEGETLVKEFIVSTGLPGTPTVTGEFRIWVRTPIQDMYGGSRAGGDYYYLKDVQWVQYFYEDYSFHSTYWHNNFGRPMSRGCVNMTNADAEWLYNWAFPEWNGEIDWFRPLETNATLVIVHE